MIRFLFASMIAVATLTGLIVFQWPTPMMTIPLPALSNGTPEFVASTNVRKAGVGEAVSETPARTVFRSVLVFSARTSTGTVFDFVDGIAHRFLGHWELTAESMAKNKIQKVVSDERGNMLVALGKEDSTRAATQRIIEVDPWTQRHRDLPLPVCSPSYDPNHRLLPALSARRIVELIGDPQDGMTVNVYSLDATNPLQTILFPKRNGSVTGLVEHASFAEVALTSDGKFLVLAESWEADTLQSELGCEVWNLETGELHCRIVAPALAEDNSYRPAANSENWKVDPEDQKTYPIVSRVRGHCQLRTYESRYVALGWAPRKKYGRNNAWQMNYFGSPVFFDLQEQRFDAETKWAGRFGDEYGEGPRVDSESPDGTTVWLSKFPRWELKTARLTDGRNVPLSDWHTLSQEVCSDVSDELDAFHVPGTLGVVKLSSGIADSYSSIPHAWLAQVQIAQWASSEWSLAGDRVYWYDFATDELQLLRRSGSNDSLHGYGLPTDDHSVYLQTYVEGQRQLEVWSLPPSQPRWWLSGILALATGSVAMAISTIAKRGATSIVKKSHC